MVRTLFTAMGCAKCKIVKRFMDEKGIVFEEADIKGNGKDAFRKFYGAHRKDIVRGREGIEFPVLSYGNIVRQGLSVILSYLVGGMDLEGFIGRNEMTAGWIGGIHLSKGDPSSADDLAYLLGYLKKNGFRLQLETNGKNASVLARMLQENLGDRVYMEVLGPVRLYDILLGEEIEAGEIEKSVSLVNKFPEYAFYTTVAPILRQKDEKPKIAYLSPDEIGETAEFISKVTGSSQEPYVLKIFDPETSTNEMMKNVPKMAGNEMFKHRTAARRYQRKTEIEKE